MSVRGGSVVLPSTAAPVAGHEAKQYVPSAPQVKLSSTSYASAKPSASSYAPAKPGGAAAKPTAGRIGGSVVLPAGAANRSNLLCKSPKFIENQDTAGPVAGHEAKQYSSARQVSQGSSKDLHEHLPRRSITVSMTKSASPNVNPVPPPRSLPTPARAAANAGALTSRGPVHTTVVRQYQPSGSMTARAHSDVAGERLDLVLSPGDVLCVQGDPGAVMRLGATGGFMGHVLLVTAPPRGIHRHTAEAVMFQGVWPVGSNVRVLWLVRTMESTRDTEGFHETDHLIYVEEGTGNILVVAEEKDNHFHKFETHEKVEVWQCPLDLRKFFRLDVMYNVLAQMRRHEASWSWSTAVRAFLFSAQVPDDIRKANMMQEIQECWSATPICTSLVVVFWQRYLCDLARLYNNPQQPKVTEVDALDWILQWMPLKSDRALPGELLSTMHQCGWEMISCVSQEGRLRSYTI